MFKIVKKMPSEGQFIAVWEWSQVLWSAVCVIDDQKFYVWGENGERDPIRRNTSSSPWHLDAQPVFLVVPESTKEEEPFTEKSVTRGDILLAAHKIINGQRVDSHGKPEDSFYVIAAYWTTYLLSRGMLKPGAQLEDYDASYMLTLMKMARMSGQKPSIDNPKDATGYLGIGASLQYKE